MSFLPEILLFLCQGIADRSVGALFPTSPWNVRRILSSIDYSSPRTIVEYGPGTGAFTRELLRRLSPDSRLIAIERNPRFLKSLRTIRDPRLTVIEGDALEVRHILARLGVAMVDAVISGIPFSALTPLEAKTLALDTSSCLKDHGRFLVYQYTRRAGPALQSTFPSVQTHWYPWNLPPMLVFDALPVRARL